MYHPRTFTYDDDLLALLSVGGNTSITSTRDIVQAERLTFVFWNNIHRSRDMSSNPRYLEVLSNQWSGQHIVEIKITYDSDILLPVRIEHQIRWVMSQEGVW